LIYDILYTTLQKYWYIIPALLLFSLVKSRWFKGKLGEIQINNTLKDLMKKPGYELLKNITLKTPTGTTQIDHIVISRFGVFVIETKNLQGWIFGKENQKQWTQKIYRSNYKFQNPLHQNYKHQKSLEELLGIDIAKTFSIVVFTNSSEFKTPMPENVLQAKHLIQYIQSKKTEVFTAQECETMKTAIETGKSPSHLLTDIKHVHSLKKKYSATKTQETCPKCGSAMVKRKVRKGPQAGKEFVGCSGFPKCRFVVEIL